MKRKLLIAAAGLAFIGIALFSLSRGARRIPRSEPEHSTMTVVADLPKTNASAPAGSSELKIR